MPSLAELLGFARPFEPWKSYPTPSETPTLSPFDTWRPQSFIDPSSLFAPASTSQPPIAKSDIPSGGILGDHPIVRGETNSSTWGGILQNLFPDTAREATPAATVNLFSPAPLAFPPADLPTKSNTPITRPVTALSPKPWTTTSPWAVRNPTQESTAGSLPETASPFGFPPDQRLAGIPQWAFSGHSTGSNVGSNVLSTWPFAQNAPTSNSDLPDVWPAARDAFHDLSNTVAPALADDAQGSANLALRSSEGFRPSQPFSPSQMVDQAQNAATAKTDGAGDIGGDPMPAGKAIDPAYALSHAHAQATIASDLELHTAARMAENAGDKDFRDRLATIMADLKHDPEAALDAIRSEIFTRGVRSGAFPSGANVYADLAMRNAADRLDTLQPCLGVFLARAEGIQQVNNLRQDEKQVLYSIAHQPIPFDQKMRLMAQAGLFDVPLAASLFGIAGLSYRGGLLGPADRPGASPGFYEPRVTPVEPKSDQVGVKPVVRARPFTDPTIEQGEPLAGRPDLEEFRVRIGVPYRHTVGIGRTNVPGLENTRFEGASPWVRDEAGLPRATPGPIASPSSIARDRGHAEEDIANQFVRAVEQRGLQPSDLDGHKLVIHISNPNGVCSTCRWGLNSDAPAGVLKQLSQRYPGLAIHIRAETQPGIKPASPIGFTIKNGRYIDRSDQ
jgi:hypothetical protein